MPLTQRRARATALAIALAMLAGPAQGAPPTKLECAGAHREAQRRRGDGDLRGARQQLLVCSRDPCPKVVVDECVPWLVEVERAIPSVVLEARTSDGRDVPDVRVSMDGVLLAERLDGRALDVNPGAHVFRFEPAGHPATELRLVVAEGEKARIVRIAVEDVAALPRPAEHRPVAPPPSAPVEAAGPPRAALVTGGIGVLALGGFAFFAASGLSAEHDLSDCSPRCSDLRISAVERRYVAADVFLGVGVVALAAATYLWLTGR